MTARDRMRIPRPPSPRPSVADRTAGISDSELWAEMDRRTTRREDKHRADRGDQ